MPLSTILAATCFTPERLLQNLLLQPISGVVFGFLQIGLCAGLVFLGERFLPGGWMNWIARGALGLAAAITGGAIGTTIWIWRLQNLALATWCTTDDAGRDLLHDRINVAILVGAAAFMAPTLLAIFTGTIGMAMSIMVQLRRRQAQQAQMYAVSFAPWNMPPW